MWHPSGILRSAPTKISWTELAFGITQLLPLLLVCLPFLDGLLFTDHFSSTFLLFQRCEKNVAATKRFTVHCAPKVLTVCLKRFDYFTAGKISKVVEYPEYLDLRPYMSQADGEPLLYSLYAVLVHSGVSCHGGHYFCYTKASNGLWYRMDDESVQLRSIDTVLRQQAYLLFYARCSDLRIGERASSSLAPSHAPSFLSQCVASSKQAGSVGPQGLTGRTKPQRCSLSKHPTWIHPFGAPLAFWS
ncbi:ubiquitin carboxyl-terminal hydrolase 42-like isoform X2 [Manacus candei]|uniref:ubiquitin carboxyl-terminal hydrolase 42-like isoform X2 n=1 Tax=Manacus candei TaxID=415023 RepID=UPI002227A0C2|nr:ubiquitin carboxyl-terminal hydrolase 42-like isoform X2 [Manacus candei]